jgi:D-glycero-D-manno-heptose 1,7-bisphosphate phosphatase
MIGDSESDIICGRSSGCKTIRILYGDNENTNADFITKSLFGCVEIVKKTDMTQNKNNNYKLK